MLVGVWPAHNDAASTSKGPWPKGTFKFSHYNAHAEMGLAPACYSTAYGCHGIYVFEVSGRPGMGVHAGRTLGQPDRTGGKTLGCIRVPVGAMQEIGRVQARDPVTSIRVEDNLAAAVAGHKKGL